MIFLLCFAVKPPVESGFPVAKSKCSDSDVTKTSSRMNGQGSDGEMMTGPDESYHSVIVSVT